MEYFKALCFRDDRHRDRCHRPQHVHRHGLLHRHQLRGRGRRADPPWRRPHGDRGVHGDAAARGGARGLRQHARPGFAPARRAHRNEPALRPDPRRLRPRRGRGRPDRARGLGARPTARGAPIYAEVVGYGSTADGHDMVQPIERGSGSARAMKIALERRGVPADEVDVINPHGTSTPVGDKREAEAIWTAFGDRASASRQSLLISATKSMTGHMMGAAGAFEAFATVMTIAEQTVPGTINYREFDPDCDVWVRNDTTEMPVRYALSNNIGLGGHNGAIIFKPGTAADRRYNRANRGTAASQLQEGVTVPSSDLARRAVVTGLGAVMPIGNDFETLLAQPPGRRDRHPADHERSTPRSSRCGSPPRSWTSTPDTVMDPQDGPPDEPLHPPRDGRRQGGGAPTAGIDFEAMTRSSGTGSASSSTRVAAGSSRSSRGRTSTTARDRASSVPFAVPALSGSMAACMLSMEYRLSGPVITQVAACATSVIAFHDALRLIQPASATSVARGRLGGPDQPMGVAALSNMTALSKRNDSPETASRPFDATRDGFVLGEGAGVVVVESRRTPCARGATPIAEVLGGALTADAFHISAPDPTGRGQARAMVNALRNSGVAPDEIDWIVAHGTATSLNDSTETRAIKAAYGSAAATRAISSPKSMIGHLVGAAGIASALAALGGIRDGVISAHREPPHAGPGVRPGLRAARRAPGQGRHRRDQRLRVRRPERGHDLPPLRGVGPRGRPGTCSPGADGPRRPRGGRRPRPE